MRRAMPIVVGFLLTTLPATALQFPEGCRTPPATVTQITGIDTQNARMEAKYTMPDIIYACHAGFVHQGTMKPDECMSFYMEEQILDSPPLQASADCVAGVITVEGMRAKLPIDPACANGGFQLIDAFKTLCPSYEAATECVDERIEEVVGEGIAVCPPAWEPRCHPTRLSQPY